MAGKGHSSELDSVLGKSADAGTGLGGAFGRKGHPILWKLRKSQTLDPHADFLRLTEWITRHRGTKGICWVGER